MRVQRGFPLIRFGFAVVKPISCFVILLPFISLLFTIWQPIDDRYQNQRFVVRLYRWLRWKPWFFVLGWLKILLWVLWGCKPMAWQDCQTGEMEYDTRRTTFFLLRNFNSSQADIKMNHLYTLEETFAGL